MVLAASCYENPFDPAGTEKTCQIWQNYIQILIQGNHEKNVVALDEFKLGK